MAVQNLYYKKSYIDTTKAENKHQPELMSAFIANVLEKGFLF